VEFHILGPVEVVVDGGAVALGPPKQRAVLVELLRARGAVARDRLIASLWRDEPPKSAVGSLQVYIHGLRRAVGEERIETVGAAYRLRLEDGDRVDADEFTRLVDRARTAVAYERAADAVNDVVAALELWRGAALADVAELGELATFAGELEERRIEALELRNDAWLELGRHDLVLDEIERLVVAEPYRERLRAQQILALYRDGRHADALAAYRATRDAWDEELGIEPTPALRELERAVLRHDESLAAPSAERPRERRALPEPPTPLVGRRLEIASVAALLRGQARLVTLVGAGGTGKTRVALAVAAELELEFNDGAVFVDLSPIDDPQLLVPTIAGALDVAADAVTEQLASRNLLLVLDNLEQIVDAADDVGALLNGAPRLRVLATSRTPLRLAAEHEYPVQPLPVPRPGAAASEIARNEAVQLFVARAHAAGMQLAAGEDIAALCRRLDGLPLALELAAARTKLLGPTEILERIEQDVSLLASSARDVPRRQATLAATIQWSLDLLGDDERRAFGRLGVFAGGFTVDSAAHVGVDLDSVASLVDKSLLQRRESRFAMLETVRPFAVELLDEDIRRMHAEWLTALAERIESRLVSEDDTAALLDELEGELDNIRTALGWTIDAHETELALRLVSATRPVWEIRGRLREGAGWLDRVLAAAGEEHPELRARVHGFAGTAAFRRGALDAADAHWRTMLALFEQLGDREGIARGLSDVGTAAAARGDWEESRELLEQAATGFRELGERKRLAVVLGNLGHVAGHVGDFAGGIALTVEALELEREVGDRQREAVSLNNLGSFAAETGDHEEARRWLSECAELSLKIGYREVIAHVLVTHAKIALAEGDPVESARVAAAADVVFADIGSEMPGVEGERFVQLKEEVRLLLGDKEYARIRAEVEAGPVEDALLLAAPNAQLDPIEPR
jgi:predicted ATPase/DNA-binding SARP family transcriptional activator